MSPNLALAFTVIALSIGFACGSKRDQPAAAAASAPQVVAVATALASTREVAASFEETGSFVADELSDIAPSVAGRVMATPVDVGQFVKKGQIICELDHRDAQFRLEQARAQMAEATAGVRQAQSRIGYTTGSFDPGKVPEVGAARATYESAQAQADLAAADAQRYANLVASGDVSRSAFERARTLQETAQAQANAAKQQYEAALNGARQSYQVVGSSEASLEGVRAQLALAEKALSDTTIRAPFDGYITARPVAAGEYVALTSKIATVVRIGTLKLDLQTPEQRASRARVGMTVIASVSAYPGRNFEGKVSAANPSVDPNSRVFILEAKFPNADTALRPGMFATARILLPGGEQAVFVPRSAVIRDKTTDSNQVFAVQNGRARLRVVVIGETDGDSIRIVSGLSGNERVIINNQAEVFDGAPVQVRGASHS